MTTARKPTQSKMTALRRIRQALESVVRPAVRWLRAAAGGAPNRTRGGGAGAHRRRARPRLSAFASSPRGRASLPVTLFPDSSERIALPMVVRVRAILPGPRVNPGPIAAAAPRKGTGVSICAAGAQTHTFGVLTRGVMRVSPRGRKRLALWHAAGTATRFRCAPRRSSCSSSSRRASGHR